MGTNSKHTEGKIEIHPTPYKTEFSIKTTEGKYIGLFSAAVARPALMKDAILEGEANAKRIVQMWNNWDDLCDLLREYIKMYDDLTYGDVVWRLAVKEKAEKIINS